MEANKVIEVGTLVQYQNGKALWKVLWTDGELATICATVNGKLVNRHRYRIPVTQIVPA